MIRVEARCTSTGACCPDCTQWTEQVHSSYLRFPVDLPTAGRRAQLALRVRRFFCAASACERRTFVEQMPGLTRRHGRVTERLRQALGGRSGWPWPPGMAPASPGSWASSPAAPGRCGV
ncbi:transposase family protein [Streptomyces acidicola]|uniref:transposase family protein n=1 Tax=Streptomyces acidicola TaxID=2596892 RepID=UPI0038210848